jgi:hypothetical protein
LPKWNPLDDARLVSTLHNDPQKMADDWASRVKKFFDVFYVHQPARVQEMAALSSDGILVSGYFAGWYNQRPELVEVAVILSGGQITSVSNIKSESSAPYTTNAITRELIAGASERARVVTKKWNARSSKIPMRERDWRMAAFYVRATSEYDQSVGDQKPDVLEVKSSGVRWVQNTACGK